MSVVNAVLWSVASLLGMVATWSVSRLAVTWLQAYRQRQQVDEIAEARRQAAADDRKANEDSDRLRDIEGR